MCELLEIKATLSLDIRTAYKSSDKDTLRTIANDRIPEILRRFESFESAFREQWYRENKTFGFDVQELYMGGAKERLRSAAMRLNAYLNGDVSRIEEVEQPMLDFYCSSEKRDYPHLDAFNWKDIVTCNII